MIKQRNVSGSDILNFFASVIIAVFSLFIGGAWFIGLILEPDKSENFLIILSQGLLLAGIGCILNCIYLLTKKIYLWIYWTALALVIVGYGLAIFGQAIYNNL